MLHELKIDHERFGEIWEGSKTHEVRVNDRNYKVGDNLCFKAQYPCNAGISANECEIRKLKVVVTNITQGGTYGLPENICCMSIIIIQKQTEIKG